MSEKDKKVVKKKVKKVEKTEEKAVEKTVQPKERKVPFKNYMILLGVCALTIVIISVASITYQRNEHNRLEIPVIRGSVPELMINDVDNYIVEHDDLFLYIGAANDYNSREVEKDMIKYFDKKDIRGDTIYVNVTKEKDLDKFYADFNKKYVVNDYSKLENYPAFIIIKDSKVLDLVQRKNNQKLTVSDIDRLLDEYSY